MENAQSPIFSSPSNGNQISPSEGAQPYLASIDPVRSSTPKKKTIIITVVSCVLLAAIGLVVFLLLRNDGSTDRQLLSVIENYYDDITGYQKDYIFIVNGEFGSSNPFNASTKEYMDKMSKTILSFKNEISDIKSGKISKESARDNLDKLRSDIDAKSQTYIDTTNLYNLFYEYANNKTSETENELLDIADSLPEIKQIMDSIDKITNDNSLVLDNNLLQDIFKIYYKNDLTEIYYFECMGDIIGELKNAE